MISKICPQKGNNFLGHHSTSSVARRYRIAGRQQCTFTDDQCPAYNRQRVFSRCDPGPGRRGQDFDEAGKNSCPVAFRTAAALHELDLARI